MKKNGDTKRTRPTPHPASTPEKEGQPTHTNQPAKWTPIDVNKQFTELLLKLYSPEDLQKERQQALELASLPPQAYIPSEPDLDPINAEIQYLGGSTPSKQLHDFIQTVWAQVSGGPWNHLDRTIRNSPGNMFGAALIVLILRWSEPLSEKEKADTAILFITIWCATLYKLSQDRVGALAWALYSSLYLPNLPETSWNLHHKLLVTWLDSYTRRLDRKLLQDFSAQERQKEKQSWLDEVVWKEIHRLFDGMTLIEALIATLNGKARYLPHAICMRLLNEIEAHSTQKRGADVAISALENSDHLQVSTEEKRTETNARDLLAEFLVPLKDKAPKESHRQIINYILNEQPKLEDRLTQEKIAIALEINIRTVQRAFDWMRTESK